MCTLNFCPYLYYMFKTYHDVCVLCTNGGIRKEIHLIGKEIIIHLDRQRHTLQLNSAEPFIGIVDRQVEVLNQCRFNLRVQKTSWVVSDHSPEPQTRVSDSFDIPCNTCHDRVTLVVRRWKVYYDRRGIPYTVLRYSNLCKKTSNNGRNIQERQSVYFAYKKSINPLINFSGKEKS